MTLRSAIASDSVPTSRDGDTTVSLPSILLCLVLLILAVVLMHWYCRSRWHSSEESQSKLLANKPKEEIEVTSTTNYGSTDNLSVDTAPWQEDAEVLALRIPFREIRLGKLLSRGGYGEVYQAQYQQMDVVVKRLLPDRRQQREQVLLFLQEATLMASLDHERLVSLVGIAWETRTDPRVVVEYMDGGDLQAMLSHYERVEHRPHGFDEDKRRIAEHILEGLAFLHSCTPVIVHGDLTSRNVLLDSDGNAKLSDFAVHRDRMDRASVRGFHTSLWTAPEVVLGQPYDARSDIFSFGLLLAQLDSHQLPFAHVGPNNGSPRTASRDLLQQVALGRVTIQLSANVDRRTANLARSCVALNPEDRPTADEALDLLLAAAAGMQ